METEEGVKEAMSWYYSNLIYKAFVNCLEHGEVPSKILVPNYNRVYDYTHILEYWFSVHRNSKEFHYTKDGRLQLKQLNVITLLNMAPKIKDIITYNINRNLRGLSYI